MLDDLPGTVIQDEKGNILSINLMVSATRINYLIAIGKNKLNDFISAPANTLPRSFMGIMSYNASPIYLAFKKRYGNNTAIPKLSTID